MRKKECSISGYERGAVWVIKIKVLKRETEDRKL